MTSTQESLASPICAIHLVERFSTVHLVMCVCMSDVVVTPMVISIVLEKCGITSCILYNQPLLSNVFKQYIKCLEHCVQEVQQQKGVSYLPGIPFTSNITM